MKGATQHLLLAAFVAMTLTVSMVIAEQDCPGVVPWRLKCPEYCCVKEFDEPLEGQYCCSSCRYSFDSAVRNSFSCTTSHYLQQTWAVVLMACGIAFIVLVCCTCCCCCCCAPCRRSRSRQYSRRYSLAKDASCCASVPIVSVVPSSAAGERLPLLSTRSYRPPPPTAAVASAPPAGASSAATDAADGVWWERHPDDKKAAMMEPPPYHATESSGVEQRPPPPPQIYRP